MVHGGDDVADDDVQLDGGVPSESQSLSSMVVSVERIWKQKKRRRSNRWALEFIKQRLKLLSPICGLERFL